MKAGQGYRIVDGAVPPAPREGAVIGATNCAANHAVLVIGNFSGRPLVEVHLDAEGVDAVIGVLREAKRGITH